MSQSEINAALANCKEVDRYVVRSTDKERYLVFGIGAVGIVLAQRVVDGKFRCIVSIPIEEVAEVLA